MGAAQIIGRRYELGDPIGQGGMGTVYRGVDTQTGHLVAIKALKPEYVASDPELLERFARESEALRRLNHPNIVKMLETIQEGDRHYIIMEYVAGGALRDLLSAQGQLPLDRTLLIALDIADALTRAHRLSIVHRDIKPGNILLAADGTPRLVDFGVAHMGVPGEVTRITWTGLVVGTYAYLSPEACNGDDLDARTDIWSFGVVLYEMLAGVCPFDEKRPGATIAAILTKPVPDLETLRPNVPVALADLIYRMLEKDVNRRIPSIRLVGAELEAIMQGGLGASPSVTASRPVVAVPTSRFATPVPVTADLVRHNLPAQTTPFVGRETELAELARLFKDPSARLITLIAPGGMGKTRLALEAASARLEDFPQGVFFVSLAPLDSPEFIIPAIADAMNLSFYGGAESRQQLLDYLREKRLLLIMDNFEHLLDGAALVNDIMQAAPNVRVLATSRERLNLSGETIFTLSGMDFPEWETLENALDYSAIRLFVQSARRTRPDFELRADNLLHVARICRLVQGMPLGILLAAAWMEMLSPEEIGAEIARSLDFLETEMRDMPERHRSIRAVFEYSYNLLSEAERDVFRQLAVFRGGFTREAAQEITGASLRTLNGLVNKSLLHRNPNGRYGLHELLQRYAYERLGETLDQRPAIQERFIAFYTAFLDQRQPALLSDNPRKALDEIESEIENIHTAWRWAVERGRLAEIKQTVSALPLLLFYELRGRFHEGEALFSQLEQQLRADVGEDDLLLWRVRSRLGWIRARLGLYEQGKGLGHDSLVVFRARAERQEMVWALNTLCYVYMMQGHYEEAQHFGEECLTLAEAIGDEWGHLLAWNNLGYVLYLQGNYTQARHTYEDILARQDAPPIGRAYSLNNMGEILRTTGDYAGARRLFEDAFTVFSSFDNLWGCAAALNHLGGIAFRLGEYKEAERKYLESYVIYQELGDRAGIGHSLRALGDFAYHLGNYDNARQLYQESLTLRRKIGDQRGIADSLQELGHAALASGNLKEAMRFYKESLDIRRTIGNQSGVASSLNDLARLALLDGQNEAATALLQESRAIASEIGDPLLSSQASAWLGMVAYRGGDAEQAGQLGQQALALAEGAALPQEQALGHAVLGFAGYGLGDRAAAKAHFLAALKGINASSDAGETRLALVGMAALLAAEGQGEHALTLLVPVLDDPAALAHPLVKAEAERLRERLARDLSQRAYVIAWDRGETLGLAAAVAELLEESA